MPKKKQTARITINTMDGGVLQTTVVIGKNGRIKIPQRFAKLMSDFPVCEKKKPKSK